MIKKVKPIHLFAEITRVDDDSRTIEAYAFVNETVKGEGGVRLKRSAMEKATPDYMKWANIRRMHQPDAVGVAQSVEWDGTGAKMVLEVVDDAAWEKVQKRVYKGLSVGVVPEVMRGHDVEQCRWIETSLVDRPKDPDAIITAIRAEGFEQNQEYDCEVEEVERGLFTANLKDVEGRALRYMAFDLLSSVLWEIQNGDSADKEDLARTAIDEFRDYICPIVSRGELEDPALMRSFTELPAERVDVLARMLGGEDMIPRSDLEEATRRFEAESLETTEALKEALARVESAEARVTELEKQPVPKAPIAKSGSVPIDRTFLANAAEERDASAKSLREELVRCEKLPSDATADQRAAAAANISRIRRELTALGEPV